MLESEGSSAPPYSMLAVKRWRWRPLPEFGSVGVKPTTLYLATSSLPLNTALVMHPYSLSHVGQAFSAEAPVTGGDVVVDGDAGEGEGDVLGLVAPEVGEGVPDGAADPGLGFRKVR
jgi:hypothetical protein